MQKFFSYCLLYGPCIICIYLCQTCFVLSLQYFEKVFVCSFVISLVCFFCFVVAAFICMAYSTPCCCHYKLKDPWNIYIYVCVCVIINFSSICSPQTQVSRVLLSFLGSHRYVSSKFPLPFCTF